VTIEHHKTFDGIHRLFAGRFQRDNLVFQIHREVSDLLSDGHLVDNIFIFPDVHFRCDVCELDICDSEWNWRKGVGGGLYIYLEEMWGPCSRARCDGFIRGPP
jgi:hypothetical protein